jgi:hypothetical protein
MKFKAIGLVLVLGLSLSGCASTDQEDLRTCQDAAYRYQNFLESVNLGLRSGADWDFPEIQTALAKDLLELSGRQVSSKLSDALFRDAAEQLRLSNSDGLTYVKDFCSTRFGKKLYYD